MGIIILFILLLLFVNGINNELILRRYEIKTNKINRDLKIVHLSDLHSCIYGKNQGELINRIDAIHPDIILMSGDMFDERKNAQITYLFLKEIASKYDCYFASGNHEYKTGIQECKKLVKEANVHYLENDSCYLEKINIIVCGVEDPYLDINNYGVDLNKIFHTMDDAGYTILLAHHPEFINDYFSYSCDLVLCGHAHGGQWRIPKLLNGLYAPHQGLFPKYAGGLYKKGKKVMIVNRGLALNTKIPRIYNRPEMVLIDIKKSFDN